MLLYHMIALAAGIVLDLLIGDPYWMPHPIRLIGRLIAYLDKKALPEEIRSRQTSAETGAGEDAAGPVRDAQAEMEKGRKIVLIVTISAFAATLIVIIASYLISVYLGMAVEAVLTAYVLAAKSLREESMKVYRALKYGTLEQARYAVSMIVGRDTDVLDKEGITKAAVETVAENTSDGVIAPLIYTAIGGPVFGMVYKSINTMDSMIGYKNNRYLHLGRTAAKLDDAVNFVPARISAWLIIFAAWLLSLFSRDKDCCDLPVYDAGRAEKIFLRDRFHHKSPNSAQTESAVAGALGIQLAGDAVYFGETVSKPTIGDAGRKIEITDIRRSNKLMYTAFISGGIICLCILAAIHWII